MMNEQIYCAGSSDDEQREQQHHVAQQLPPSVRLTGDDDDSLTTRDARSDPVQGSAAKDINEGVALETSSPSPSRKRRLSHSSVNEENTNNREQSGNPASPAVQQQSATSPQEPESKRVDTVEPRDGSVSVCGETSCDDDAAKPADDALGRDGAVDDAHSSSPVPSRYSRRTLYIEYWSRTDECKERKWDHLDDIAEKYGCAEDHIFDTTLRGRTACLEPNMFPYDTPAGIEHWTLWHVKDLSHGQIKQYVENWIDANAPHVVRWNYDDNPERSIDIFHVHVYLQVADGTTVLEGRKFDDLAHEMD